MSGNTGKKLIGVVCEASIIAKSGEAIMSSLKLEMAYSAMIGNVPHIDFIHDCHKGKKVIVKLADNN